MEIKLTSLLYILDLLHFCRRRRRPTNDRAAGTERSQSNSHNVVCFRKFASLLGVDQTEDQVNGGEKWKRYFSCNCSNLWLRNRKKRNVTTSRLCTALIWSLFQVLVREIVCFCGRQNNTTPRHSVFDENSMRNFRLLWEKSRRMRDHWTSLVINVHACAIFSLVVHCRGVAEKKRSAVDCLVSYSSNRSGL